MDEKLLDSVSIPSDDGVYMDVHVIPGSSRDGIMGVNPWRKTLDISLKEKPVDGGANKSLIELLSTELGVDKENISIVKGHKIRDKRVFLKGCYEFDILRMLSEVTK